MSRRVTVEDRAEQIFSFLRTNLNKPYRLPELLAALRLHDSDKTRRAIRRARGLAEAAGLFLPVACPANGQTYIVTTDPVTVLDPAIHLARIEAGTRATKETHQEFMRSRLRQMDPGTRQVTKAWLSFEERVRAVNEGAAELTQAMVAIRREGRQEQADGVR
jgi:DNA-binding response OmpR family regulator